MSANAPLVEVTRGGIVESRHHGSLVLLDAAGRIEVQIGDPDAAVYARSALKPLQAATLLRHGFAPTSEALALSAASHDGAPMHTEGVRTALAAVGLAEDDLRCPPDLPWGRDALLAHVAGGGRAERACHNCSGKHAGMLATCLVNDWPLETYLRPEHPLQVAIVAHIEQLCGEPVAVSSVDGCGAPAHALGLAGLARGFRAITTAAPGTPEARVAEAMRRHPLLVGGEGRAVSELMAEVDGLVCKDGAEAVWAAALPDGRAFAAKVSDGAMRALPPLLAAALAHWGFDGPAVRAHADAPILGGTGAEVGRVTWSPELRSALGLA